MKHLFARGPVRTENPIPNNATILAVSPIMAVVALKKKKTSPRKKTYKGVDLNVDKVEQYRKNGFDVFTVIFETKVECIPMNEESKIMKETPLKKKKSPVKKKITSPKTSKKSKKNKITS